jgi:hypothetical protein
MSDFDLSILIKLSASELLEAAKAKSNGDQGSLPKSIHLGSFTLNSKLPYKATLMREVLCHRFNDFANAAVELYAINRIVPAFVLTRAAMENTAMMYTLFTRTSEFVKTKDIDSFDQFLMKGIFGSRNEFTPLQSNNILTAIDHIDKKFTGTRDMYDILCEFTHPNYAGAMGAYCSIDEDEHITYFGKEHVNLPAENGLIPLLICFDLFTDYYNSLAKQIKIMNDYYEQKSE